MYQVQQARDGVPLMARTNLKGAMFCHPEPGVSRVRNRTTVNSREVVDQIVTLPAAFPFLLNPIVSAR
jgi:hypothetical protein